MKYYQVRFDSLLAEKNLNDLEAICSSSIYLLIFKDRRMKEKSYGVYTWICLPSALQRKRTNMLTENKIFASFFHPNFVIDACKELKALRRNKPLDIDLYWWHQEWTRRINHLFPILDPVNVIDDYLSWVLQCFIHTLWKCQFVCTKFTLWH